MTFLWSVLGFILTLGILVTIHEWGHYIVGRWLNVKIEKFSIGFGRPIWTKQRGETQFQIAAIPLGGYVKFADEREGPVAPEDIPRAFNRQPVWKRILIVLAGPMVNLLFAWMAFSTVYLIGVPDVKAIVEWSPSQANVESMTLADLESPSLYEVAELNDMPVEGWNDFQQKWTALTLSDETSTVTLALKSWTPSNQGSNDNLALNESYPMASEPYSGKLIELPLPLGGANPTELYQWLSEKGLKPYRPDFEAVVSEVLPNSPAEQAGLQSGDRIMALNATPVSGWKALVTWVRAHPGESVTLNVLRNGQEITLHADLGSRNVSPDHTGKKIGFLGASVQMDPAIMAPYLTTKRYSVTEAMKQGIHQLVALTEMTFQMIRKMVVGEVGTESLAGPIGIAQLSGEALQSGVTQFIGLLALLSLSLGLLNLLPIPVLDGGHIVLYTIEWITGRPLNEQWLMALQGVGLFLILSLTAFAIFNDVQRIVS